MNHLRDCLQFGEFHIHLEDIDEDISVNRNQHLVNRAQSFHVPALVLIVWSILTGQNDIVEMDVYTPIKIPSTH